MRKSWMLASTLLLSSCAMVQTTALGGPLILKPQIQAGSYSTKTVVNSYTQASINHLILKLYTYDGTEHDTGIQKSIPNAQLTNSIAFSNLRVNTTYRIKAYAYASSDESNQISTNDANSYTEVTLTNDDRPTITALKVRLIDIAFNGQGTGSLQIANGGYSYAASESVSVPYIVSTFAGGAGGTALGYADGTGTSALFRGPMGIALDGAGNLYVADANGNTYIRKITNTSVVSTFATGFTSFYSNPAVDGNGNVYAGDSDSNVIKKITSVGAVSIIAGSTQGAANGTGTAATFNNPRGVAVDGDGNVYVADCLNHLIRKISNTGVVTTLAGQAGANGFADGTGTAAKFFWPCGVAVDSSGNVYVADQGNNRIRKITNGVVTTLAGNSSSGKTDGTGISATFAGPSGITLDGYGNLYVADAGNGLIRKITSGGVVTTIAGSSTGYNDGTGQTAKFNNPWGVAVDGLGNIYVADYNNHLIRRIR